MLLDLSVRPTLEILLSLGSLYLYKNPFSTNLLIKGDIEFVDFFNLLQISVILVSFGFL